MLLGHVTYGGVHIAFWCFKDQVAVASRVLVLQVTPLRANAVAIVCLCTTLCALFCGELRRYYRTSTNRADPTCRPLSPFGYERRPYEANTSL